MNLHKVTQAQIKELLHYEDGKLYWRKKVSRKTNVGDEAGTFRKSDGYRQIMINRQIHRTHRLVYLYHYGHIPDIIDHINQNPADNRIENLRPATRVENGYNSKFRVDNTSGVRGVTWDKNKKKWVARLYVNRACINLGRFSSFDEASQVVKLARIKHHGQFASEGMMPQ